jgi:hypothetical protein
MKNLEDKIRDLIDQYGSGDVLLSVADAWDGLAESNRKGNFPLAAEDMEVVAKGVRKLHGRAYRYTRRA